MWKLACGAVLIVLLGATHAVPACTSGCGKTNENFCQSDCYTDDGENLLYTLFIDEKFHPEDGVQCKVGSGTCPPALPDDLNNCGSLYSEENKFGAFIKDADFRGTRCRFITVCQSMEEANVLVPCEDCSSERTCASCPSFTYKGGSTMVHWLCEMQGDAYDSTNKPAEGVECKPTAYCAALDGIPKPESIICAAGEDGQDGNWMAGAEVVDQSLLEDLACECLDLRIPEATDTNVFCDSEPELNPDGDYIIKSSDKCELVCDGQVFIPIECRFTEDKTSASWNIVFDGETVDLGADAKCLACSLDNCQEEPTEPPPFMVNY